MNAIDALALAGWGGEGAEVYERARPGYPPEAIAWLGRQLGDGGGRPILDLAAGTGKLTRHLRTLGVAVLAVEPVAEMRAQFAAAVPGVEVRAGSAEAIPLADGSVAAVTVAQAFHWFDVPRAAAEIARVLAPDGLLAAMRNDFGRAGEGGWLGELDVLLRRFSGRHPGSSDAWAAPLDATGRFTPLQKLSWPNEQPSDLAHLQQRVASTSFIAALSEPDRAAVLEEVAAILARHGIGPDQRFDLPHTTTVRWARRR